MSVQKRVRSEASSITVEIDAGEYIQYLISSPSVCPRFSLMDATTNEVVLSDRVPPTMTNPSTHTRLWPIVGDHPRHESSLVLAMNFTDAEHPYTFRVQHRNTDGTWTAVIDVDFIPSIAGDWYLYSFRVLAQ